MRFRRTKVEQTKVENEDSTEPTGPTEPPSPSQQLHHTQNNHRQSRRRSFKTHIRIIWTRARLEYFRRRRTSFVLGLLVGSLVIFILLNQTEHWKRLSDIDALAETISLQLKAYLPANSTAASLLGNFTAFITDNLMTPEEQLPAHRMALDGYHAHYPVFIIPGIVSTNLESWARGSGCADNYFRKKIWGDVTMASSLILDKKCWLRNLMLDFETGLDSEGAKIRAVQGLDAANYFIPGYWVWAKIMENLAIIGYDSNNMHLAAYDWRLSFENLERRDHFFSKLRSNLQMSKRLTGRKAVIMAHSMGGNVLHYFLKWSESPLLGHRSGWVNEHIESIVNIATPFLGAPKTLATVISGEMRDTAQLGWFAANLLERFFTRRERASLFRSWGGVASMLPKGGEVIWGNETFAPDCENDQRPEYLGSMLKFTSPVETELFTYRNYTAESAFEVLINFTGSYYRRRLENEYSHGIKMDNLKSGEKNDKPKFWSNPLEHSLPYAKDLTIYAFYGVGKSVERSYFLRHEDCVHDAELVSPNSDELNSGLNETSLCSSQSTNNPDSLLIDNSVSIPSQNIFNGVVDTDGDGTVPLISLGYVPLNLWRWKKDGYGHIYNPSKIPIISREYLHEPLPMVKDVRGGPRTGDHVDILGNHEMTVDILKIVSKKARDLKDRFYSQIQNISQNVKLKQVDLF